MLKEWSHGLRSGVGALAAYGVSVALMAVASLAVIKAMIAADGPEAWGAIALGQAVGYVSCIIVGYGWALSGPAKIARADPAARRREYADSLRVRLVLLVPGCALSALIAASLDHDSAPFAMAGAVSFTLTGLTGNWYFVGVSRPITMLLLETCPRVAGMLVGVVLMHQGRGAMAGLACMSGGMLLAFLIVTVWVYWSTSSTARVPLAKRSLATILAEQRSGVVSASMTGLYLAMPLAIIALVAPTVQPAFALADRVKNQLIAAMSPLITVLQAWVPRGLGEERIKRARLAFYASCLLTGAMCAVFVVVGPSLFHWLGNAEISVSLTVTILVGVLTALAVTDQVVSKAVLAPFFRLHVVAWATVWGTISGIPLIALGSVLFGAPGALTGAIAGMLVRIGIQVHDFRTKVTSAAAV